MHIGVLGASGATGRLVVQQALHRGWTVTAVVRNLDSMKDLKHDNLKVVLGDVFNADSLAEVLEGCEAVVTCLGLRGLSQFLPWTTCTIYSQSMISIVAAMRKLGLRRLVLLSGACTKAGPDNPLLFEWVLKPIIYAPLCDMARTEDYLTGDDCPDVDYTVVKPTNFTNGPATEGELKAVEGQYAGGYFISRADVARFMLDCLTTDQWNRKLVAIAPQ